MASKSAEPTKSRQKEARKRVRDPAAHRSAILAAARSVFAEHGYSHGTIREIAQRAGVTHGLVVRHFQTKENLFISALLETRRSDEEYVGAPADLPAHIARSYIDSIETHGASDPFIALIRSAGDVQTARELLHAMRREPAEAYLGTLDIDNATTRADLLGALLIGVTFSRYILKEGELAAIPPDRLCSYLTSSIRAILFDPLDGK